MKRFLDIFVSVFVIQFGLLLIGGNVSAKEVIFSPIEGKVLLGGKALSGLVLERSVEWDDTTFADKTTTDDNGNFSFPIVSRDPSWLSWLLPSEPMAKQTIGAAFKNQNLKIWFYLKRNWALNSENDGKPIRVECHIDQEPKKHGKVFGLCQFL